MTRTTAQRALILAALLLMAPVALRAADGNKYNVVWNSPSKDATGVMPIGNGDIAAGQHGACPAFT